MQLNKKCQTLYIDLDCFLCCKNSKSSTHVSIHVQSISCQSLHGQINQHKIVQKSTTICYRLIDHKSACNINIEEAGCVEKILRLFDTKFTLLIIFVLNSFYNKPQIPPVTSFACKRSTPTQQRCTLLEFFP